MARFLPTLSRYRIPLLALALSAALHAAVMVGLPKRIDALDEGALAMYSATLDTSGTLVASEAAPVAAAPRPARSPRPRKPRPAAPPPPSVAEAAPEPIAEPAPEPAPVVAEAPPPPAPPQPMPAAAPEVVAQAAPKASEASEPDFTAAAFPNEISIQYQLTSAFADGRATYHWEREGDSYRITGEAAAEGFFTLFLEGTLLQESRGTVTRSGLRPERFSENRPGAAAEGLEFDWAARKVTFDRNGSRKTSELADNTVDWLSMIFQLAHAPPHGQTLELRVFTQRKLYRFELLVLGEETIDIPLGSVRALHLRHVDKQDPREVVDVWLGVEQHNLPVKLRYPVARNRLVVEQVATRVSTR